MVENNKERSITLSPGRSYDIGCTSSAGFNTNDNKWFTVNLDSTLTSITENTPASNNESAVYMFQPNPDDNNRWILRLQNFASSMTNTYVCISPTLNKSLTINEGTININTLLRASTVNSGSMKKNLCLFVLRSCVSNRFVYYGNTRAWYIDVRRL